MRDEDRYGSYIKETASLNISFSSDPSVTLSVTLPIVRPQEGANGMDSESSGRTSISAQGTGYAGLACDFDITTSQTHEPVTP